MISRSRFAFPRQYHSFLPVSSLPPQTSTCQRSPKHCIGYRRYVCLMLCGCRPFDSTFHSLCGLNQSSYMHDEFKESLCIPSSVSSILTCVFPSLRKPVNASGGASTALGFEGMCVYAGWLYQPLNATYVCLCGMNQRCLHDEYEEPLRIPLSLSFILTRDFPFLHIPALASGSQGTVLGFRGACAYTVWLYRSLDATSLLSLWHKPTMPTR